MKSEENLQADSSCNCLQNMLFLVSSIVQVAKHQMTVLSRFGVHICTTFWVEINVNKFYMSQATFSWRLLHTSNIVLKNVPPLVNFGPPAATSWRRTEGQGASRPPGNLNVKTGFPYILMHSIPLVFSRLLFIAFPGVFSC